MDTVAIREAAEASLAGTMPFPEIVAKLIDVGVEYYHVDYVGRCKHFYDGVGARVTTPITFEGLPAVAGELDVAALRANILDSQQNRQSYRDFTIRAMKQGVHAYYAFLRGLRVTYLGGPAISTPSGFREQGRLRLMRGERSLDGRQTAIRYADSIRY